MAFIEDGRAPIRDEGSQWECEGLYWKGEDDEHVRLLHYMIVYSMHVENIHSQIDAQCSPIHVRQWTPVQVGWQRRTSARHLISVDKQSLTASFHYPQLKSTSGDEVARWHREHYGLMHKKHSAFLEISQDLLRHVDLDEIVVTWAYCQALIQKRWVAASEAAVAGGSSAGVAVAVA